MSAHCTPHGAPDPAYRKVLWFALVVNGSMFVGEIFASAVAGSAALAADAADFAGDAASYALSIAALAAGAVWSARVALGKGIAMVAYALGVIGYAVWRVASSVPPEPLTMGFTGSLAFVANLAVAWRLYAYREGDANMRSVWLCSRNDALGNLAVVGAALGVFGTGTAWPDIAVATTMAALSLHSARDVIVRARTELRLQSERTAVDSRASCG